MAWTGGAAPDTQAPSAPVMTSATHYGGYVDLAWNASADNVGVAGYRVRRNGQTIATVTSTSHRDWNVSPSSDYTYCLEAFDAAGNTRSSDLCTVPGHYVPPVSSQPPTSDSGTATQPPPAGTVTQPPPDVTPPSVRVVAPGSGAKLRRSAVVRADANDTVGVQVMELWVDKVRLATRPGSKLKVRWDLKRVRPGRHKVLIVARDAAGNTSKRTVRVTVRR